MWQVVGQDIPIGFLEQALAQGRLAHSYLFAGPPHVGKRTLALNLAQAVNCLERGPSPCGSCASCRRIIQGIHADVQVIDLEGERVEIGIDRIRELQHAANLKPFEGKCRVFIIKDAEHLSSEAANCLLKTLEEPPQSVLLILTSAHEETLLPTIRSRCVCLRLRPLPYHLVEEILRRDHGTTPEAARELAAASMGLPGWAVAVLADPGVAEWRQRETARLQQLGDATLADRFTYAAELATQFGRSRDLARKTLGLWLYYWRDLLLVLGGVPGSAVNADALETLKSQTKGLSTGDVLRFLRRLYETLDLLDRNVNARLALEVLMLELPVREAATI